MRAISKNKKCPTCGKDDIDPSFCFNFMRSKPCNCKICKNPHTHRIPSNMPTVKKNNNNNSSSGSKRKLNESPSFFEETFKLETFSKNSKDGKKRHKVQLSQNNSITDLPTMVTRIPSPEIENNVYNLPETLVFIKEEQGTQEPDRVKKVYCKVCEVTLKVHSSNHITRHQSLHKHVHLECIDQGKPCSMCDGTEIDISLCRYPNCDCRICKTRKYQQNGGSKQCKSPVSSLKRNHNSTPKSKSPKSSKKSKPTIVFTDSEDEGKNVGNERDENETVSSSDEENNNKNGVNTTLSASFGGSLRQQQKQLQSEIRKIVQKLEINHLDKEESTKLIDQLRQKEELLNIIKLANT